MDLGIFIPIANNGWLISKTAPQYLPSFELNKAIVQKAEAYGFDFALSMVRFLGFGGDTKQWDYSLESFTLMAGLAAVTTRIKLFASTTILAVQPTVAARMAQTIDSIAPGRFGVNIVTGWSKPEFQSLGLWPGDDHFQHRYARAAEYVRIMRDLWERGESTLDGKFYQTNDAKLLPKPKRIEIIGAGQSGEGMRFVAENGDYSFIAAAGVNAPLDFAPIVGRLLAAKKKAAREICAYVLFMIIAEETDEAAMAKWDYYGPAIDYAALDNAASMSAQNAQKSAHSSTAITFEAPSVNLNTGTLIGSYETVAKMLDQIAAVPGVGGIMLIFDDFISGLDKFGTRIQPLMQCRDGLVHGNRSGT